MSPPSLPRAPTGPFVRVPGPVGPSVREGTKAPPLPRRAGWQQADLLATICSRWPCPAQPGFPGPANELISIP